jgi:hypothetical protein
VEFALRWDAPPALRPATMQFDLDRDSISDESGKVMRYDSWGGSGGPDRRFTVRADFLPPGKSKTLSVRVRVVTKSARLRPMQWYRRFRFDLPLSAMDPRADGKAGPSRAQPLQEAHGENVAAALEAPLWLGDRSRTQTKLWMRNAGSPAADLVPAADVPLLWFVKDLKATDEKSRQEVRAFWNSGGMRREDDLVAWRLDGQAVADGERCQTIYMEWGDKPRPAQLSVEATVEARLVRHSVATFKDVPLPPPGQAGMLNRKDTGETAAPIVLRQVRRFENTGELPGLADEWRRSWDDEPGVALLFEVIRALEGKGSEITLVPTFAEDDAGRDLKELGSMLTFPGDALRLSPPDDAKRSRWRTVLLPLPDAALFTIQVVADETAATGQLETLLFSHVAVPGA